MGWCRGERGWDMERWGGMGVGVRRGGMELRREPSDRHAAGRLSCLAAL